MKTIPASLAGIVSLSFPAAAQLVFTGIHYHPVEGLEFNADGTTCHHLTNDIHEFVEIQNTSGVAAGVWVSGPDEIANSVQASATPQMPPTSNISRPGTKLMFSWPVTSAAFTLQLSTNLASGNLVTVTSAVTQNTNGQWQVIMPPSANGALMFYR
ncbi:MAG: hypothetical protein ABSE90_08170 [Verrucomicrobiota bacterium]